MIEIRLVNGLKARKGKDVRVGNMDSSFGEIYLAKSYPPEASWELQLQGQGQMIPLELGRCEWIRAVVINNSIVVNGTLM